MLSLPFFLAMQNPCRCKQPSSWISNPTELRTAPWTFQTPNHLHPNLSNMLSKGRETFVQSISQVQQISKTGPRYLIMSGVPESNLMMTAATCLKKKAEKHRFLIVEVSEAGERRYPKTLFGCETLEEALKLCKQMNTDAGFQKFAVRGNATDRAC